MVGKLFIYIYSCDIDGGKIIFKKLYYCKLMLCSSF